MKLPDFVVVLGHRFTISHLAPPGLVQARRDLLASGNTTFIYKSEEDITTLGDFSDGMSCFRESWISINPRNDIAFQRETLLHEILHVVDRMLLVGNKGEHRTIPACKRCDTPTVVTPVYMNEATVLAFSRGLFATLIDPQNKLVRDFIFGDTVDHG